MIRHRRVNLAACVAGMTMFVGCSGDDSSPPETSIVEPVTVETSTASTEIDVTVVVPTSDSTVQTDPPEAAGWAVATDVCDDPATANASIEGTVQVGSVMPLTGAVAAPFVAVKDGFEAYVAFARQNELFVGYDDIQLTIGDDQYDPAKTPLAVAAQIGAGADLFSGIIGTSNNRAVEDDLNDACIPQLNVLSGSPEWGDVAEHPWTTGLLVPYDVEAKVYAAQMGELFPEGATVGLYYVENDFGLAYAHGFADVAAEYQLDIVVEHQIDETDSNPPTLQMADLAIKAPDAIMAAPVGAGCLSFFFELATARVQYPDWKPAVFITNSCADSLILAAAGPGADGLYTGGNLADIARPDVRATPSVQEYIDFMTGIGKAEIVADAADGWTAGEVTVAILNQAASSIGGLTRASIIEAARHFEISPSLARDGVVYRTDGERDAFLAQSMQVLQYDTGSTSFVEVGSLITGFES